MNEHFFHLPPKLVWQVVNQWPMLKTLDVSIHGPEHWMRVASNATYLLEHGGFADPIVNHLVPLVKLFALFHDSQREHEGPDAFHSMKGASYVAQVWQKELSNYGVDDSLDFSLLLTAITAHTNLQPGNIGTPELGISRLKHSLNHVFVGVCLDADRLDLRRDGLWMQPDPRYLFTPLAREIATSGKYDELDAHYTQARERFKGQF